MVIHFHHREGSIGEFHLSPPYEVRQETHFDHEVMPGAPSEITRYVVGEDGVAKIVLEPTTQVDDVRLVFPLLTGDHELRVGW